MPKSDLFKPPVTGLIHVTGEPDTGKTTFALSSGAPPQQIAFFDDDLKGQAVADALDSQHTPFGFYLNVTRQFSQTGKQAPIDLHNFVMQHLRELAKEKNKYAVLVFDDWTRMENGIRDYSMSIMEKLSSLTPGQIKAMSQLTWPYTYNYYAEILDLMLSIAPLVVITTHIREKYVGNAKTGAVEPRGQRPLVEKSSMRIWLRHNPDSPAPIGLILKRLVQMRFVEGEGIKPVSVFPRRVKPMTWEHVKEYLANPVGDRKPLPEEMPDDFEFSILDGTLTEDQKDALRIARITMDREEAETAALESIGSGNLKKRVAELVAENAGAKPVAISKLMKKEGLEVTVPQVSKWMEELASEAAEEPDGGE